MAEFYPYTRKRRSSFSTGGGTGPGPQHPPGRVRGQGPWCHTGVAGRDRRSSSDGRGGQGQALGPYLPAGLSILSRGRPNKAGMRKDCWPLSVPVLCRPAQSHPSPVCDPRVRVEKEPERLFPAVTRKTSSCPPTDEAGEGRLGSRGRQRRWGVPGRSLSGLSLRGCDAQLGGFHGDGGPRHAGHGCPPRAARALPSCLSKAGMGHSGRRSAHWERDKARAEEPPCLPCPALSWAMRWWHRSPPARTLRSAERGF